MLTKVEKNFKICVQFMKTQSSQQSLQKGKQNWRHHTSLFQIIIKGTRQSKWHKNRLVHHLSKLAILEMNSRVSSYLEFDKATMEIKWTGIFIAKL